MASALRPPPRTTAHDAAALESALRVRLARLRRRAVRVPLVRGVAAAVAVVVLTAVVAGLLDFRLHLPPLVRAGVLAGMLAAAGVLLYRLTLAPLGEPRDDLSLALRVEDAHPALNDVLASTVQFLNRPAAPDGESAGMRREAVRQALSQAEALDFDRVIDARRLRLAVAAATAALGLAAALAVWAPRLAATGALRLASPFGAAEWPRKTGIELGPVPPRLGRDRAFRVEGRLTGVIPKEVRVEVRREGIPLIEKTFAVNDGNGFTIHLKPDEVQSTFQFRVFANDAATSARQVEVLALPRLVARDGQRSPRLSLERPRYTELPSPEALPAGVGNLEVPYGTVVTLRAAADRPLKRAWVECSPDAGRGPAAMYFGAVGSAAPLEAVAACAVAGRVRAAAEASLLGDRRLFDLTFRPEVHGTYTLHFEDENELVGTVTYTLRVNPDPAPEVRLDRPANGVALPGGALALQLAVTDGSPTERDGQAIRTVWLEYRTKPDEPMRRIGLYDHREGVGRFLVGVAGSGAMRMPAGKLRLKRVEFDRPLWLRDLRHADGSALAGGDMLWLRAAADDFDDVTCGKGPGRSHEVLVHVVTREAFDAIVNKQQEAIQQGLVRALEKQREAIARLREVEARLRKGGPLAPEREAAEAEEEAQKLQQRARAEEEKARAAKDEASREKHRRAAAELDDRAEKEKARAAELRRQAAQLSEAEELQQGIRERVGNQDKGLRAEVESLREMLRQNGLENSNAMDRLNKVADELRRLAEKELQQVEPKLAQAREKAELLDDARWKERQAALERQAKAAELEAQAAEKAAKALEERAKAQPDAPRLRAEAKQHADAAAKKRAEADQARKEARQRPTADGPRQALSEARQHQDEVDKSLTALLRDLEPWSSTNEVRGEAGRILQEQRALAEKVAELKKEHGDKSVEELTPEQKAELEAAQEQQRRLQARAEALMERMRRMAEKKAKNDPQTARDMKQAADEAQQSGLSKQMKGAQDAIGENKLNEAGKQQQAAIDSLRKMVRNLEDRRDAQRARDRQQLAEAERKIEELMDAQERLQRKVREAAKLKGKEREEELKRLAKEQQKLAQQAKELVAQLSREGNDRARQSMSRAAEEMDEAAQQLSRGQRDDEKQEDVLDRLEETRREVERARRRADEELGREQIIRAAEVIKRYRDRQEALGKDVAGLQGRVQERGRWERGHRTTLGDLAGAQRGLAEELRSVVKKDLNNAPVFAKLLEMAARSMDRGAARLDEMRGKLPPVAELPDAEAARHMKKALERMNQLLDSLKEAEQAPRPLSRPPGGGGGGEGGEGGGGGPQGDDSLPPPAQIRLLRAMQKEVNDRTEAFLKKHPDLKSLTAKERAELEEVRREQKEVLDLFEQLLGPGAPLGDEEKKGDDEGGR